MKSAFLYSLFTLLVVSCKSPEQIETNKLSGGWRIMEITYAQRGATTPDSTVSYKKSAFEFGSCQLTSSNRECFGYYSLNGIDRTSVTYSVNDGRLYLSTIDQNNRKGIDLTGSLAIEQNNGNVMILSGPAGYTDKAGKFQFQAFDVRMTLTR